MSIRAQDNESTIMRAYGTVLPLEGAGRGTVHQDRRIGTILAQEGKLDLADIKRVLELQQAEGLRFGEATLRLDLITADDLRRAIAKQYDLPHLLPDNARVSRELVVAYQPFHPCAEEMRALRMQLLIRWSNGGMQRRAIAIVSPGAAEGRSYLVANLAVAFSQLGERTLLIGYSIWQTGSVSRPFSPVALIVPRWCRFPSSGRFRCCRPANPRPIHWSCYRAMRWASCCARYKPSSTWFCSIRHRRTSAPTPRAWVSRRAACWCLHAKATHASPIRPE
jgi:hypothetical protein